MVGIYYIHFILFQSMLENKYSIQSYKFPNLHFIVFCEIFELSSTQACRVVNVNTMLIRHIQCSPFVSNVDFPFTRLPTSHLIYNVPLIFNKMATDKTPLALPYVSSLHEATSRIQIRDTVSLGVWKLNRPEKSLYFFILHTT